ncbi:hypothetical protein ABZX66_28260 [Micromonospora aurantiaca]|uniref:hypothetical protein n=1 Tax=Micromonospora aurantiaca (nom. illeg.) TaxID=47850 RepID=UPI0033A3C03F
MTAADLSDTRPATDLMIGHLRETLGERLAHEHPREGQGPDLFCLNLTSYMGERMGPVLRRLADEQAETKAWKDRHTALADEFAAEADRLRDGLREVLAMIERFDTPRDSSRVRVLLGDLKHVAARAIDGQPSDLPKVVAR